MSAKRLDNDCMLYFLTRVFRKTDPDPIEQMTFDPIEPGDIVIGSLTHTGECEGFQRMMTLVAEKQEKVMGGFFERAIQVESQYEAQSLARPLASALKAEHKSSFVISVLQKLFWECAYDLFPEVDGYDEIFLRGNWELTAKKSGFYVGPDGLSKNHPIRTFYPDLARIMKGEILFDGNLHDFGFRGDVVGRVESEIGMQIHLFAQKMNSRFRQTNFVNSGKFNHMFVNRPHRDYLRAMATFNHMKTQVGIVHELLSMAFELEEIDFEHCHAFGQENRGMVALAVDHRWNIVCVDPADIPA